MNKIKRISADLIRRPSFTSFLILVVLVIVNAIIQPNFFSYRSLKSNFMSYTPLIFAAVAQGMIILSGSIDLSLGSTIALLNCLTASMLSDSNVFKVMMFGLFITLVVSGVINGLLIGKLNLSPLITTFATSAIYLGIAMIILPKAGGYVPRFLYNYYKGSFLGIIPNAFLLLILGLALWLIFSRTSAYRYIYAVGSNEDGAFASGISILKTRLFAHLFSGFFIFLAGVCVIMFTSTGDYRTGSSYTMNSIAAVVIGGISLSGGKGSMAGAVWGALILGVLNNIIFYSHASSYFQVLAKGLIIVAALCIGIIPALINNSRMKKIGGNLK